MLLVTLLVPGASLSAQPRMAAREALRIASSESSPGASLTTINAFLAVPHGYIYTAHSSEGVIRIFDSTGRHVKSFGRKGQGPGEFAGTIARLGILGDTIWARDDNARRINLYTREGVFLRSVGVPSPEIGGSQGVAGYFGGDRFALRTTFRSRGGGSPLRTDSTLFLLTDRSGAGLATLHREGPFPSPTLRIEMGGRVMTLGQPYLPVARSDLAPDSRSLLFAAVYQLWNGGPGQVRLTVARGDGNVTTADVQFPPLGFNASDVDTFVNAYADRIARNSGNPAAQASVARSLRDGMYRPDYFPPIDRAKLGSDGAIWLRMAADHAEWRVFSLDGHELFRVELEADVEVVQVSRTDCWTIASDSAGLPVIRRFLLTQVPNR